MATATLTIGISSSIVTGTKTFSGTDQDIASLLSWASATLTGSLPSNPSNAQVLTALANNTLAGLESRDGGLPDG